MSLQGKFSPNILEEGCASTNAEIFVLVLDLSVLGSSPLYCGSNEPSGPVPKLGVARQILAGDRGRKEGVRGLRTKLTHIYEKFPPSYFLWHLPQLVKED